MPTVVILCEPRTRAELGPLGPNELQIDLPLSLEEGWRRNRHGCAHLVVECEGWRTANDVMSFLTEWWPGPERTDPRPPLTLLHRNFGEVHNLAQILTDIGEMWGNTVTASATPAQWRSMVPGVATRPPPAPPPPVAGGFAPGAGGGQSADPYDTPPPPIPTRAAPPVPSVTPTPPPPGGWSDADPVANPRAQRTGGRTRRADDTARTVLMWGIEGGIGTTQIARALAHALADHGAGAGWRAVLVDTHCNDGLEMLAAGNPTPHIGEVLHEPDSHILTNAIQSDGRRKDVGFIPSFENPATTLIMETRQEAEQIEWFRVRLEMFERAVRGHLVIDAPAHQMKSFIHYADNVVLISSASHAASMKLLKTLVWLRHLQVGGSPAVHWIVNHGTARQPMSGGEAQLAQLLHNQLGSAIPEPIVLEHCREFMLHGSDPDEPWNYSRPLAALAQTLAASVLAQPRRGAAA